MTPHNLRIWALICAENARIEAMKAENQHREMQGLSQAFGYDQFIAIYSEIQRLAEATV